MIAAGRCSLSVVGRAAAKASAVERLPAQQVAGGSATGTANGMPVTVIVASPAEAVASTSNVTKRISWIHDCYRGKSAGAACRLYDIKLSSTGKSAVVEQSSDREPCSKV